MDYALSHSCGHVNKHRIPDAEPGWTQEEIEQRKKEIESRKCYSCQMDEANAKREAEAK